MSEFKTVKMKRREKGSVDGINLRWYEKGQTYDLPTSLADVFIKELKCATEVRRAKAAPKIETPEDAGGSPETPESE